MDVQKRSTNANSLPLGGLAGLQTGILGGASMLLFLCAHSLLRGQPWWSYANLLGSMVYGSSALWRGLGRATLAGLAFQFVLSGAAGVLFGVCFARTRGRLLSLVLGLAGAVLWFGFCHWILFRAIAPLIPVYASQPATILGYLILGLVLSRTAMLYAEMYPERPSVPALAIAVEPAIEAPVAESGTSDASQQSGTGEIVPPHRLE